MTYTFGPLERRGLLGPVRAGQAALLAAAGAAAIAVLDVSPSATGALVATGAVIAALAASFVPVGGRTLQEWMPIVATFGSPAPPGRHRFISALPTSRARRQRARRPGLPAPAPATRTSPASERRADHLGHSSGPGDGGAVGAIRTTADGRARLPGGGLLAAGPRGTGAPAGRLGTGACRRRAAPRSGACSGWSARRRLRATSWPAGSTPSVTRRCRRGARRWSSHTWSSSPQARG